MSIGQPVVRNCFARRPPLFVDEIECAMDLSAEQISSLSTDSPKAECLCAEPARNIEVPPVGAVIQPFLTSDN